MVHVKNLAANRKAFLSHYLNGPLLPYVRRHTSVTVAHMAVAGFLSRYQNGPTPFNRKYSMLNALLKHLFRSFLPSMLTSHYDTNMLF